MAERIKRRKPAERRKTEYLRVRVSREQLKMIQDSAARAGISTSAWTIERLLRAARDEG